MSAGAAPSETEDDFLGGRLRLTQPKHGYRAGIDPVLLAAACPARPGESVLDLGCGVGAAALCLGTRVPDLALTGVEVQPDYADLARRNAAANGLPFEVVCADLCALPPDLRQRRFDHVIVNPPYFDRRASSPARDAGRDLALGGGTPLADWLAVGAKRLAPKGWLTVIQRADRYADLVAALPPGFGGPILRPIAARQGRQARLVLMAARKGGGAAAQILAPWILHEGARHLRDGDDYTEATHAILRHGAILPMVE